ncbi:glycosyltransferase [Salinibacterium sp. UTAS2018]|uniref:glycosyltransferase n=1 Tax=Salinibacterium sp. UTAS2018 TaxID=2508880 RepID=UPI00143DC8CF|nr:glycosyltransferase [Salinibacterium sp. UTAS2018]
MKPTDGGERVCVVHVSSAHPWTDNRIHYRECVSLQKTGYDVHLIAIESAVEAPKTAVHVVALPRLPRLKRVVFGSVRAVRHGLKTRASIFHLHDPELVWAVPLLRLLGKKVIFDAHEDLPIQVLSKEYLAPWSRTLMKAAAYAAVGLMKMSNHVIAATETIAGRFPEDRVSVVHNYPPLRAVESAATPVAEREKLLVYVGAMGATRGAAQMVDTLNSPSFPADWRLELAGSMAPALADELGAAPGWSRVNFHGPVPPDEARNIILSARVGLVVLQGSRAYRESLPTKMFEYFAAGVPVIASDFPLWRSIIERYECGLLVNENSPVEIADAVAAYAANPVLLEQHSRNARKAATDVFNWTQEVPTLEAVYQRVLSA